MALRYSLYDRAVHNEHTVDQQTADWVDQAKVLNDYGFQCVYLEADGLELMHILSRFTGLPGVDPIESPDRLRWSGDHAKFIAMNFHNF